MSNFHFIFGAKGGIGKTLFALSLLIKKSAVNGANNQKTLIVDYNFFNHDLSKIIDKLDGAAFFDQDEYYGITYNDLILLRPKQLYKIINVNEFIEKIIILKNSNVFGWAQPTDIIIDTSFWVSNFIYLDESVIQKLKSNFGNNNLYIWLLWTLNTLKNPNESTLDTIIDSLLKFSNNFGFFPMDNTKNKIDNKMLVLDLWSQTNVRHIFNVYSLFVSNLKYIFTGQYTHGRLKELYLKHRSNGGLGILKLKEMIGSITNQSIAEQFLSELIVSILSNCRYKERPQNIFPIHSFINNISGYTDEMCLKERISNIEEIKSYINGIYEILEPIL